MPRYLSNHEWQVILKAAVATARRLDAKPLPTIEPLTRGEELLCERSKRLEQLRRDYLAAETAEERAQIALKGQALRAERERYRPRKQRATYTQRMAALKPYRTPHMAQVAPWLWQLIDRADALLDQADSGLHYGHERIEMRREAYELLRDATAWAADLAFGGVVPDRQEAAETKRDAKVATLQELQSEDDRASGIADWLDSLPTDQREEWLEGRRRGTRRRNLTTSETILSPDDDTTPDAWAKALHAGETRVQVEQHFDSGYAIAERWTNDSGDTVVIEDYTLAEVDPVMVASERATGWTLLDAEHTPTRRQVQDRRALTTWIELRERTTALGIELGLESRRPERLLPQQVLEAFAS